MTRDPMRCLRAANPVPELPPLTPIAVVMPGWEGMGSRDEAVGAGDVPAPRSPKRWTRAGTVLIPALSITVVVVIVGLALTAIRPANRSGQSATSHAATYSSPEGWSISYPAGFTLRLSRSATQVTLSSFPTVRTVTGRPRNGASLSPTTAPYTLPLDPAGRFPTDGVVLVLQPFRGFVLGPDSSFPIDVSQFGPAHTQPFFTPATVSRDGIPPARSDEIVAYGEEVTATAIIGPKASPAFRSELAAVVKSLAFRRLAPGTQVAGDSYLVGPANRFPVGSFTRIQTRVPGHGATPVYLVHAPGRFTALHQCPKTGSCTPTGAFYAMGETYNTRLDHAPNCQIQFDRQDEQFYCTNLGVRWDRVGRVVKQPADEKYIGAIGGDYAKVTWDGQVMITPGWGPPLSTAAVHLLWPSWHQPKHPNAL